MKVDLFDVNMNPIILRGVTWLEFTPRPVEGDRITENVYNSEIVLGKSTKSRMIDARLTYEAHDYLDYKLLRNQLYNVFNPVKDMWAVDTEVPGIMWKVDVDSFDIERINGRTAIVSVVFYSPKTYARSIGDSRSSFTYNSGLWSYGMGLLEDLDAQSYVHNTSEFQIYNPSNVLVDPREHELEIKLLYFGSSILGFDITNDTTGDVWSYDGILINGDTVIIDGILSKRNGLNIVGDTGPDFGLISLAEGFNDFRITGLNGSFEIFFKFPFLYV